MTSPRFETIYMVGHAHLDPVWLWPWTEGYQEARATLRAAIRLIEENPDYIFTFEQMAVVEWIRESEPQLFQSLQRLVAAGRIALVGGWWVEPDCNLPSLESFVRQGLIGQRYLLEHFGGITTVGLNADPFGHTASLPQILTGQRITNYCFLRPGPHEGPMPHSDFDWVGLGGSRVRTYRIPHEYCTAAEDIDDHMDLAVSKISGSTGPTAMVFYGVGNHGGGPTRRNLNSLQRIDGADTHGALVMSGPARFFAETDDDERPEWQGELQRHAAGCYAAHSGIKAKNLRAEARILEAERLATLAARRGAMDYPEESLRDAWKSLLFNQFHDILPGSSLKSAYDQALDELGSVLTVAGRVTNRALQSLARDVDIPEDELTQPILAVNPHPWPVRLAVELELSFLPGHWKLTGEAGTDVPWQRIQAEATVREEDIFRDRLRRRIVFPVDIPAFGHRLYRLHQTKPEETVTASPATEEPVIENGHLRVRIDQKTGWLAELRTKTDGIDYAPPPGSRHTVVSADKSDTWGHHVDSYVTDGDSFVVEDLRVSDDGPVRSSIRVTSRLGMSRLTEHFILDHDSAALEIRTELDWRETLSLLKLRYPSAIKSDSALYQMQYGAIARPADGAEQPGQRWVSVANEKGSRLTVLNDAKFAYDTVDGDIGITAARSPVYAWHDPRELRDSESYDYQDQGIQRFTVRLLPQQGHDMGKANQLAEEMLMPPRIMMESFHSGHLPAQQAMIAGLEPGSMIRLTALKPCEDDPHATILRFVNDSAKPESADIRLEFLNGASLKLDLAGFEIRTVRFSEDGSIRQVDLLEFDHDTPLPIISEHL